MSGSGSEILARIIEGCGTAESETFSPAGVEQIVIDEITPFKIGPETSRLLRASILKVWPHASRTPH
jgi:hypothetical protein